MSKQVLILDASQVSTYKECNEKYRLGYRENYTQISVKEDEAVDAGTYGHKLLETYYRNLAFGVNFAVTKALAFPIAKLDLKSSLTTALIKKIQARFGDYWMKWHNKDFDIMYKKTLVIDVDSTGNPIDRWINEPVIEKGFSVPILDTSEFLFILEGKIDMIARTQLGVSFVDNKWQFRERDLYTKSVQFKSYALATGLKTGVINYIRLKQNLDESTLVRQPISFNPAELTYWKQELIEIYRDVAKAIRTGNWNHNWDACAGKFGYKCEFTNVCEEWNPRIRKAILDVNFKRRKEWRPW